jgi:sugar phosphate permease
LRKHLLPRLRHLRRRQGQRQRETGEASESNEDDPLSRAKRGESHEDNPFAELHVSLSLPPLSLLSLSPSLTHAHPQWFTPLERGLFCGLYNILLTTGYYIALGGCPVIIQSLGFEFVFSLPAACLLVCFLLMLAFLQEAPTAEQLVRGGKVDETSALLASGGASTDDLNGKGAPIPAKGQASLVSSTHTNRDRLGANANSLAQVDLLKNPTFLCYLLAIMNLCWVRDGLVTWVYSFLEDAQGHPTSTDLAAMVGGGITLGGFAGGVLCGLVSDYVFDSARAPPILLFSFFQALTLTGLYLCATQGGSDVMIAALVLVMAIFMLGNYTLLSYTVPTDLPPEIVATAAGVMTAAGYASARAERARERSERESGASERESGASERAERE